MGVKNVTNGPECDEYIRIYWSRIYIQIFTNVTLWPKSIFWDHFLMQTSPQNPPKRHLRNQNRASKSDFWPFCVFLIFLPHIPLSTGQKLKVWFWKWRRARIKKLKKQTSFKIQFYIGIQVTSFDFQQFYPFGPNSTSPNVQVCQKKLFHMSQSCPPWQLSSDQNFS